MLMKFKLRLFYLNLISAWIILISLLRDGLTVSPDSAESICRNEKLQTNCGQCIKSHIDCNWCTESDFTGSFRCDTSENLQKNNCPKENVYKPKSKVENIMNRPLRDGHTHLQPQRIQIVMKPGETVLFPLKYLHSNAKARDVYILNSETESQGLQLSYVNDCLKKLTEGRSCSGAKLKDIITYNVSVTLKRCSNQGDAVVSIGIGGLKEVVALYVTPTCGCKCEKVEFIETRAPRCNGRGNLVCGSCVCLPGTTGKRCDCESSHDKCKQSPSSLVCSGRGKCECGVCKCENPEILNGEFCECDITSCPIFDGIMCAGYGACDCGKCICDAGRTGQICECPISHEACVSPGGKECSEHGVCQCGKCVCNEGFDGDLCEINEDEEYKAEQEAKTGLQHTTPSEPDLAPSEDKDVEQQPDRAGYTPESYTEKEKVVFDNERDTSSDKESWSDTARSADFIDRDQSEQQQESFFTTTTAKGNNAASWYIYKGHFESSLAKFVAVVVLPLYYCRYNCLL